MVRPFPSIPPRMDLAVGTLRRQRRRADAGGGWRITWSENLSAARRSKGKRKEGRKWVVLKAQRPPEGGKRRRVTISHVTARLSRTEAGKREEGTARKIMTAAPLSLLSLSFFCSVRVACACSARELPDMMSAIVLHFLPLPLVRI